MSSFILQNISMELPYSDDFDESQMVIDRNGYYGRSGHFHASELEGKLTAAYGRHHKAVILPSGMAAIGAAFSAVINKTGGLAHNIIMGDELYCDTPRTIKYLCKTINHKVQTVNISDDGQIEKSISTTDTKYPIILFLETCSNPCGDIFNFDKIKSLQKMAQKRKQQLTIIADNTWLTSALFNPFDYNVDLVVVSLTKYYSGGACIGGAVMGNGNLIKSVEEYVRVMGIHTSPFNCVTILKNIDETPSRIKQTSSVTQHIVDHFTKSGSGVRDCIVYVGLSSHKSHDRLKKFCNGVGPSVFTMTVPLTKNKVIDIMKKQTFFPYLTSFGSLTTRVDPWPTRLEDTTRIRIAIGYGDEETTEILISKFTKLFQVLGMKV